MLSTIPLTISEVSIPVVPRTPGATAHTERAPSTTYCGVYFKKCLVISNSETTFGPSASGVTNWFPRPTTNISSSLLQWPSIIFFSSSFTTLDAFSISSSAANFKFLISIVTYVPY